MSTAAPSIPTIIETPSKQAASQLAQLEVKDGASSAKENLLSKMTAARGGEITMENGKKIQHASAAPRGKFVGDLSITDDSQEPLLQESDNRFVLFPIKYHEVSGSLGASRSSSLPRSPSLSLCLPDPAQHSLPSSSPIVLMPAARAAWTSDGSDGR